MKTLTKIKPYSDSKLKWDEESKQYILTIEYFKDNFDDNFVDDGVLVKRLKKNSRKIYRFIRNRVNSRNLQLVENLLATTEQGRQFMLEILSTQMEADAETGFNDLSSTPAVNLSNGQVIDRNEFYKNQVSVDAEQVFDDSDSYFGFRIGYQAPFPPIFFTLFK